MNQTPPRLPATTEPAGPPPPRQMDPQPIKHHTFRRVWLPFLLVTGVLIAVIANGLTALTPRELEAMSSFVYTCFCLLPVFVCLLPVYLGLMAAVYGMHRLNSSADRRMQGLEAFTRRVMLRTGNVTDNLNRRSIGLSAVLARFDPLFNLFNRDPAAGHPSASTTAGFSETSTGSANGQHAASRPVNVPTTQDGESVRGNR